MTRAAGSSFKPQELSSMLWAFAKVEIMPTNLDAFDTTLLRNEYRPSSSEISSDPVAACFGIAGEELMKRPQQFKPQEIKDVLWAFSKVRHSKRDGSNSVLSLAGVTYIIMSKLIFFCLVKAMLQKLYFSIFYFCLWRLLALLVASLTFCFLFFSHSGWSSTSQHVPCRRRTYGR